MSVGKLLAKSKKLEKEAYVLKPFSLVRMITPHYAWAYHACGTSKTKDQIIRVLLKALHNYADILAVNETMKAVDEIAAKGLGDK